LTPVVTKEVLMKRKINQHLARD